MTLVESFSGVRGIFGSELTEEIILKYAFSFGELINAKSIVIGRDTRESSANVRSLIIEGLSCNIIDTGILPTPGVQNAVREFKADGGIIITASHNEPKFNGLKFLDKSGGVIKNMDELISKVHSIKCDKEEFLEKYLYKENNSKMGKRVDILHNEVLDLYIKFLLKHFNKKDIKNIKKNKVLLDPNGGAGIVCKQIFEHAGIKAEYLNLEEGKFNRIIEPNEKSLSNLKSKIGTNSFAAGFDCDADRVEIMLSNGNLVSGNEILALIVDDILTYNNETVVVNDATSYLVKEIVQNHNAKFREVEVGEVNVVHAMIDHNSPIGGEGSNGGVIIPPSRCRDGILTILYLLKIMGDKGKSLEELTQELPKYHYIKEKVNNKKWNKEAAKKHFLDQGFLIEESGDKFGGLKAIKDNSWVWFRKSKTEDNVLRIIVDSKDIKEANNLLKIGKKLVARIN